MIPFPRRRAAAPKTQPHFSSWSERSNPQNASSGPSPASELSPVTINFITPPVRCKVYQPMELRCNGVKVTPGPITAELQSFNPKTPKSHKAAAKLEDSGHRVLVKFHSMGSIHLRFPVAGQWSLSVEYEGVVYTKLIEVHGQRGKQAKLQSKLAADALHGGQMIQDEIFESEDSTEDGGSNASSATTTPRQTMGGNLRSPARLHGGAVASHIPGGSMSGEGSGRQERALMEYGGARHEGYDESVTSGMVSYHDASEKMQRSAIPSAMGAATGQNSATSCLMQHPSSGSNGIHPYQHLSTVPYPSHTQSQLQPPYPLQSLSSMSLQPGTKFDTGIDPTHGPNAHFYNFSPMTTLNHASTAMFDPYSQMPESPNVSDAMMSMLPEGSTFAYNDMGQYGSALHMKHQEADMNYIQPDAMYYPIPALSDDVIQSYMGDSPSSPSADSSDGSSGTSTPVVRSGYPFLSRMIPSSTSDVVSLGQECCLVGQNFVYSDSDANSIWFTLQANKAKVKAPIQRSTTTTHIATIPPLSYFGISYALEPLMAIVELYQYSLLVPCEQQFYYLSTQGQLSNSNKISVQDHGNGSFFPSGPANSITKPDPGNDTTSATASPGGYFVGSSAGFSNGPSFFFNTGVPSLNTLTVDNNLEAIQALVKNGADVNQPDLWGITPLHLAIFFGRKAIANFLLRNSVEKSVQTEDINGDTPLDLVIRHWEPEIRGLYDVMVSLLHDPSQTVSEADRATRETLSRRAASAGASASLPKKPSFLSKKPVVVPKEKSLSSNVPFKMEGDTLRVLRPEFWTELMVAIDKMAGAPLTSKSSQSPLIVSSSLPSNLLLPSETSQSSDSLEEDKRTLEMWSQISKAKSIDSSGLNLETFPNIPVHAFPVIESLDFSGNALKFLPPNWSKFSSLSKLDVSRNLIDILPPSLVSLPSLSSFSYEDNPLRLLPASVTQKAAWVRANLGTTVTSSATPSGLRVNTHRRGLSSPQGKEQSHSVASPSTPSLPSDWTRTPLYRYLHENSLNPEQLMTDSKVRVNVFGERYVDRRLLQKSLQVDFSSFVTRIRYKVPVISASDDVAVEDVHVKSNADLSFETWTAGARHTDFASQALISPSGIQVVVFSLVQPDTNQEAERVQYWLEAIVARAPTSPVLLVGCDSESVPREGLPLLGVVSSLASSILSPGTFNAAEDLVTVSFANGEGMDTLKRRFAEIANRHGFVNKTFPKSIVQLMQTILALKESRWFLWRSELTDLASQFGIDISTDKKFESAVQQLSTLGGLVYFSDASSERLRDIVFTDPQRLCHALTNFMMRHKRLIKDGILHLSDCHPQFVSILNGLPEPNASLNNSPPTSPSVNVKDLRPGSSSPPLSSTLSELNIGSSSPRSVSPPTSIQLESTMEQSSALENSFHASARNSKGFLTSPIKLPSRPSSVPSITASLNTTSPLICRVRIDDRVLVDLLALFEEAIKLPQESVLLPRLLPESVSGDMLQQYWSQGLAHAYERVYQFSGAVIPKVFFNRFRAYLYEDARVEVCLHWSRGMVLRYAGERARVSTPSPNTLHLHIAGDMPSRLLPMMVEMIDALIRAFASKSLAQVLIPCPSLSSATTTLLLEEAMDALRDGQTHITRGRTNIRLSVVAPDLCLQEMQALEVEESALVTASSEKMIADAFDEMLEEANSAANPDLIFSSRDSKTVWHGKLRGTEDVQVAYYHRNISPALFKTKQEYLQATSAVGLSTMKECRDEARLLTILQHPNIVRARAFNLAAQLLATETSQFGTLRTFLQSRSPSTSFLPELKLRMMLELAHAVAWLHFNRFIHGAIGLDAVLVTSVDVNPQHDHIKLGNFHNAKLLFTKLSQEENNDIKDIGTLFAQIWTENADSHEALAAINNHISTHSDTSNPTADTSASTSLTLATSAAGSQLELEISELVLSCLASTEGQSHRITINEIIQHLEYLFATNGWLLSLKVPLPQSLSVHSYWKLDSSVRILEYNKREIASISSIVRASDGQVWVATASGYIHIWNPSASTGPADVLSSARAIIQTYSIDTRQSRRRINALMTSGAYVWCITDGSICVYANDGQLVKSVMHKQSLCITKYQMPASNVGVPAASSGAGSGMVYIGGAHGEISVWDSTTFQCTLGVVLENRLPITAIAVDSRYLWIGVGVSRRICHVVALNKKTLNEICRFQAHDDLISSIVVVDDTHIWTSSFDGKINVWNIAAENDNKVVVRLERSIMTHRRTILKMTSSPRAPDGSVSKVYASDNNSIFVWDTRNNQLIDKHLTGRHRGAIGALDPIDTNAFLSASVEDGCVCLWKRFIPPQ